VRQSKVLGISSATYARWRKMGAGEIPIEKLRYISKYPRASKFSAIEYDILESVFRFAMGVGRTPKAVMDRIARRVCKKRKAKKEG